MLRSVPLAVFLILLALAAPLQAAPVQVWETQGFETPESALYDAASDTIFVSNVAGDPAGKDGNGYISTVSRDGKVKVAKWATGFDAPKGMALVSGRLYVADIDRLAVVDVGTGKVIAQHAADGAKFLNDVAADGEGRIYVSDMATNTIWRLAGDTFEPWLVSPALKNPNGLLVAGDRLLVAAWGVMTDGFATKVPGHMIAVSLGDKSISDLGGAVPVGNLDGLEPEASGASYLVTDWMAGKLYRIDAGGNATLLKDGLGQGAADIGYIAADKIMILPRMKDGKVTAFKVE